MEALAAAVDSQEADAIYVVGGDGTLGRVVTGVLRNRFVILDPLSHRLTSRKWMFREHGVLPIGVFPGGYDNLSLRRLAPGVFGESPEKFGVVRFPLPFLSSTRSQGLL